MRGLPEEEAQFLIWGARCSPTRGQIRSSLYRLKYGNKREYAKVYGREMARRFREMDSADRRHPDCPGTAASVQAPGSGGYNQAALLARELGRCTGIPVEEKLLLRVRKTAPPENHEQRQSGRRTCVGRLRCRAESLGEAVSCWWMIFIRPGVRRNAAGSLSERAWLQPGISAYGGCRRLIRGKLGYKSLSYQSVLCYTDSNVKI